MKKIVSGLFGQKDRGKMGCDCSKEKDKDKDLTSLYSKYAVTDPNNESKKVSQKIDQPLPRTSVEIPSQQPPTVHFRPQASSPPLRTLVKAPPPVQESAGNIYTLDWAGLEKDTQRFNYEALKEDFVKDPQLFLVNQLLMTVQFFKNYERDRETIATNKKEIETQLNEVLTESKKHAIVANNVFHSVQDFVGFKSLDQPEVLEPLYPIQYFIAHESIEANRKEDFQSLRTGSLQYSQIDEPIYRVCVDPTPKLGYCRLRCVDDISRRCSDDGSGGNYSSRDERDNSDDQVESAKGVDEPEISTGEEDEMEDTVSPLGGEMSFDESSRALKLSPRMVHHSPLQRSASTGVRKVFEPQNSRSDPINPERPFGPVRRTRSFENSLSSSVTNTLTVRFQEVAISLPPPRPISPKPVPIVTSLVEDQYGYAVQKEIKLKDVPEKNGEIRRSGSAQGGDTNNKAVLPKQCFFVTKAPIVEDNEKDPYPLGAELEDRTYLASRPFMNYFIDNFYEMVLEMGKSELSSGATYIAPKIRCREERQINDSGEFCKEDLIEFIPTVEISFWPDEAIEWYAMRKRNRMRDKRTNSFYQWPSQTLVMSAIQSGCHLVPLGYISPEKDADKKQANNNFNLEWQIQFTKAEHFLIRSLNHPKLRCYLFSLLIFKSFIVQLGSITEDHIRHILFWMIEEHPADWREENLGFKLTSLIEKLRLHLSREKLPNYFIRKQDMFSTLPKHKLRKAQEKFYRLNENIVPHLIKALKNLQYSKGFYPMPDLDKLYDILTSTSSLKMVNPNLLSSSNAARVVGKEPIYSKKPKPLDPHQEQMHKRRVRLAEESKKTDTNETGNGSNNRKQLEKIVTPFDDAKKKLILEFFIEHFIQMAMKSNEFRAYGQGLMYVMQAENLLTLYAEIGYDGSKDYGEYRIHLQQLREVSRGNTRDYWQINWGDDESSLYGRVGDTIQGRFGRPVHQNSSDSLQRPLNQQHQHQAPLPKVPSETSSKIPKTQAMSNKVPAKNVAVTEKVPDKAEIVEDGSTLSKRYKRPRDESISDADVHKLHYVTIDVHQEANSESTDL